jgi:glycosyltransferase involved in cell wall biosynthesis
MHNPKITTVIPIFRRPLLLKRAIESAMKQRFDNISICVYDNASGDETESVVRELMQQDHRISYVKNDENIGCIANFYKGVEAVETDYYSILSDDDILLENNGNRRCCRTCHVARIRLEGGRVRTFERGG